MIGPRRAAVEPVPAEGRPLIYRTKTGPRIGQWLGLAAPPPKHRKGRPAAWRLPSSACGWVMAVDGLVFVARVDGQWHQVTPPDGLPDPGTALASEHRPPPTRDPGGAVVSAYHGGVT